MGGSCSASVPLTPGPLRVAPKAELTIDPHLRVVAPEAFDPPSSPAPGAGGASWRVRIMASPPPPSPPLHRPPAPSGVSPPTAPPRGCFHPESPSPRITLRRPVARFAEEVYSVS